MVDGRCFYCGREGALTVADFVLARIAEDEANIEGDWSAGDGGLHIISTTMHRQLLAQCAAMRKIVELHKSWPVLVTTPMEVWKGVGTDISQMTFSVSQRVSWMTQQEYRTRFGDEPPTAPVLAALAAVWSDHADFDPAWAS
jgi:hypothetical protein